MTSSSPPDAAPHTSSGATISQTEASQQEEEENIGADGKPIRLLGSLFFALPDGGAVLYKLVGFAEGPEAASTTELETPAKTALAFTLPVSNWLRRAQRYDIVEKKAR